MLHRLRRGARGRLGLAAMLVFSLGVATQSLLGVLGEMHQVARHTDPAQVHSHHEAPHAAGELAVAGDVEAGEGGAMHVLMHHAHCCAHCAWMTGGDAPAAIAALFSAPLPVDTTRLATSSDTTAPFRPPILG